MIVGSNIFVCNSCLNKNVTWSYRFTKYIYRDANHKYRDHQSVGESIINNDPDAPKGFKKKKRLFNKHIMDGELRLIARA